MTVPSIETRQLTKTFGKLTSVDRLDLKIQGPKCVGFLGPNGAGKTTTLKMLTDMIFPTSGECFLNGLRIRDDRTSALENVGALIESPEIYPSLTPREALDLVGDLRGIPRHERTVRIDTVLSEVRMTDWADKKVGKFSKGMKQRIQIAATLLHDPAVLLLDEPSTGLDPRGMAEVRAIVRSLKRNDRLIFMSSHILSEISEVCDEVVLIDKGKLLLYDTLDSVASKFSNSQTILDVILAAPPQNNSSLNQILRIKGVKTCDWSGPRRIRMEFEGGPAERVDLLSSLVSLRIGVVGLEESESALEELYLQLISGGQ